MPNDIPDWTTQHLVQIQSVGGQLLGDTGSPSLQPDFGIETLAGTAPWSGGGNIVLASFKAAAGQTIAAVGVPGPFTVGTLTAVNPTFGQATTAGNLLIACVTEGNFEPTTAAAGWVKVVSVQNSGQWVAIWCKPNCGSGETPPQFTCNNGTTVMEALLAEFSGAAVAAPQDQTASANIGANPAGVACTSADSAFGDLIVMASRWVMLGGGTVSFSQTFNNGVAAVALGSGIGGGPSQAFRASSFSYGIVPAAKASLPLGVAMFATGQPPWLYPTSAIGLNATLAAGSNLLISGGAAGTFIYLFEVDLVFSVAGTYYLVAPLAQASPGLWLGTTTGPFKLNFGGLKLPNAASLGVHAPGAATLTGKITYSGPV